MTGGFDCMLESSRSAVYEGLGILVGVGKGDPPVVRVVTGVVGRVGEGALEVLEDDIWPRCWRF